MLVGGRGACKLLFRSNRQTRLAGSDEGTTGRARSLPGPSSRGGGGVADPKAVVILITFPADADVGTFAAALVEEGYAACVTVLSEVESVFRWEGAVERARERQLVVKTVADRVDPLRRRVGDLHPYDVPEFLVLDVAGGDERYLAWIRGATTSTG